MCRSIYLLCSLYGAVKSYSTHHFYGNVCTKSGSLRFSQFSGCWLILSVYILIWVLTFPLEDKDCSEFSNPYVSYVHLHPFPFLLTLRKCLFCYIFMLIKLTTVSIDTSTIGIKELQFISIFFFSCNLRLDVLKMHF